MRPPPPTARRRVPCVCSLPAARRRPRSPMWTSAGSTRLMTQNVRVSLSLVDAIGKDVSGRRLAYLVREAEAETREALEPFGYYSPTITVERTRSGEGRPARTVSGRHHGATWARRSRVRRADIAHRRRRRQATTTCARDLDAFKPQPGDVFDHTLYEASKARITRRLAERGYFDADFASRKVEVTRAEHAADIDLGWNSGERYDMGPVTFTQTPSASSATACSTSWCTGKKAATTTRAGSTACANRWRGWTTSPHRHRAASGAGRRRPRAGHASTLTPAKRDIYTAGLSYGTDSGAGVRLGMERRYVNDRGHKLLGQIDWAENRKTATVQYRIPAFEWLDGWYTAQRCSATTNRPTTSTRAGSNWSAAAAARSTTAQRAVASLHALRERWAYAPRTRRRCRSTPCRTATRRCCIPALRGEYIDADDRLYPARRLGGTVLLRGGVEGVGSDASFLQAWRVARWYRGLGERNRLILRGEARPHLHRRAGRHAAEPALLRRRRPQHPRLRLARGRAAHDRLGRQEVRARREARADRQRRVRALLRRHLGRGRLRRYRRRLRPTRPTCTPAWASACAGARRWGRCASTSPTASTDPDSGSRVYLNIGADW